MRDHFDEWDEVTSGISRGNTRMFERYYVAFFDLMFIEARRCSGLDEHHCMDIVQDSMLKAMNSMRPIHNRQRLEAWSRAVVRSVSYDLLRRQASALRRERRNAKTDEASHHNLVEHEARLAWIEHELGSVDQDVRRMIHFRYRLGWSLRRIGDRLGLTTGAVDGKIRRAIEKIRTRAEEQRNE